MKIISNILWAIFGGIFLGALWLIIGVLWCLTIVGIPFGVQCFKLARISFMPYGVKVKLDFAKHPIANVIWIIFFGWELALVHIFVALFNCITIIGIPRGIQCFKITKLVLIPFGAKLK
ncbi:MAG: YccF domain-containing protein [Clostridia bacterium]|nr:YccF domain-containing protein [Clostridia bacterium]